MPVSTIRIITRSVSLAYGPAMIEIIVIRHTFPNIPTPNSKFTRMQKLKFNIPTVFKCAFWINARCIITTHWPHIRIINIIMIANTCVIYTSCAKFAREVTIIPMKFFSANMFICTRIIIAWPVIAKWPFIYFLMHIWASHVQSAITFISIWTWCHEMVMLSRFCMAVGTIFIHTYAIIVT